MDELDGGGSDKHKQLYNRAGAYTIMYLEQ